MSLELCTLGLSLGNYRLHVVLQNTRTPKLLINKNKLQDEDPKGYVSRSLTMASTQVQSNKVSSQTDDSQSQTDDSENNQILNLKHVFSASVRED